MASETLSRKGSRREEGRTKSVRLLPARECGRLDGEEEIMSEYGSPLPPEPESESSSPLPPDPGSPEGSPLPPEPEAEADELLVPDHEPASEEILPPDPGPEDELSPPGATS
jgi:hypothetical protein